MAANKFPGKCNTCSVAVPAGAGTVVKVGKWLTGCAAHPVGFQVRKVRMVNADGTVVHVNPDDVHTAHQDGFWRA